MRKNDLNEINSSRQNLGLPVLIHRKKNCSKCSNSFITRTKNICCSKCRWINKHCFEYYNEYGTPEYV